jgi:hypothetical protein
LVSNERTKITWSSARYVALIVSALFPRSDEVRSVFLEQVHSTNRVQGAGAIGLSESMLANPEIEVWLRDRAVNDEDGSVRRVAERAILAAYPDDPNTLALVQSLNPSGLGFMTAGH